MERPEYYAGYHHLTPATRVYPNMFGSLVINSDGKLRLSNIELLQLVKELFFVLGPTEQASFLHFLFTTDLSSEAAAELGMLFDGSQLPAVAAPFTPASDWAALDQVDEAPNPSELIQFGGVTQPRWIRTPEHDTPYANAWHDIASGRLSFVRRPAELPLKGQAGYISSREFFGLPESSQGAANG